jgi:hypothetical protein
LELRIENSLNSVAESCVKTVLALGTHDADYVDACYGPPEWRAEAERPRPSLADIRARARCSSPSCAAQRPATAWCAYATPISRSSWRRSWRASRFMDEYRSYVINYSLGQDRVRQYVERTARGEGPPSEAERWQVFTSLPSSARLPSTLR